jgi:outer membrane protein TolC
MESAMTSRSLIALSTFLSALAVAQEVPDPPAAPFDLVAAMAEGPSLTAAAAAERAVERSPSLEEARALAAAAERSVEEARLQLWPRLELTAQYLRVDGFPDGEIAVGGDPAAVEAARTLAGTVQDPAARALWLGQLDSQSSSVVIEIPRNRLGLAARLTWPVSDLFFAVRPAIEAAEAGRRAREEGLRVTEAVLRRRAADAYHSLARARAALAVAQEAERQAVAQAAQIDAGVSAGFLTEADRLAGEARVAQARQGIAMARAGVATADAALRALLGDEDGPVYGIADPVLESAPAEIDDAAALTDAAHASRAELASLRASLDAQRAAGRASDAAAYPHLAVVAGADLANPSPYQIPPQQQFQPSWQAGVVLTWVPNDAAGAIVRGQRLASERAATEARIAEVERGIRAEVLQARAQLVAAQESQEAARVAREAAEAAYESRLAALRAGEATTSDVFGAEGRLNQARLAELDAAIQLRMARTHLAYATGRL